MPALDFKEIPVPTAGAGRDQFELFAREFLEFCGFKIVAGPDRGADGGRDLIAEEIRTGVVGENRVRWLVSCKHKAHSGASVTPSDEQDINDRLKAHDCKGFIGFYSTLPSAGLSGKLEGVRKSNDVQVYDPEKIEQQLLTPRGAELARRFFPHSMAKWQRENPEPARIFADEPGLSCAYCNKSLLRPQPRGIVVLWTSRTPDGKDRFEELYWCCHGACDKALQAAHRKPGVHDAWEDIRDLIIPLSYLRWVTVTLNEFHSGAVYSEQAFENAKTLLLSLFPLVSRHPTAKEEERLKDLMMVPSALGGFG